MPLNTVTNSAPAHTTAPFIDKLVAQANQTQGPLPPGSTGEDKQPYFSELSAGNPGGVDASRGIGINIQANV